MSEERWHLESSIAGDDAWRIVSSAGEDVLWLEHIRRAGRPVMGQIIIALLNEAYEAGQRDPVKEEPEPEQQPVDEEPEGYEVWDVETEIEYGLLMAVSPDGRERYYLNRLSPIPRFVRLYGYRRANGTLQWRDQDRMWRDRENGFLFYLPKGHEAWDIQMLHLEKCDPVLPDAVLMRKGDC